MCELIKALIARNKLLTWKPDFTKLTEDCLDSIVCVGNSDIGNEFFYFRVNWSMCY